MLVSIYRNRIMFITFFVFHEDRPDENYTFVNLKTKFIF